jgi:hypothetical protein
MRRTVTGSPRYQDPARAADCCARRRPIHPVHRTFVVAETAEVFLKPGATSCRLQERAAAQAPFHNALEERVSRNDDGGSATTTGGRCVNHWRASDVIPPSVHWDRRDSRHDDGGSSRGLGRCKWRRQCWCSAAHETRGLASALNLAVRGVVREDGEKVEDVAIEEMFPRASP